MTPDIAHQRVIKLLERHGYKIVRQRGSHIRLTHSGPPEHHLSVPRHRIVRIGTLHSILSEAAQHLKITIVDLQKEL
jgi:predicted RNA binding protein YcfA (HicA-like mRNA interferase family)